MTEEKSSSDSEPKVQGCPLPSWVTGKPSSIVRSRIFQEIHEGRGAIVPRQSFDWESHVLKQVHKSRGTCSPEKEKREIVNQKKQSIRVTKNGLKSQHLELKAPFLGIVDGKFLNRLGGSHADFSLSEVQPELDRDVRTAFGFSTNGRKKFGKYDIFCYPSNLSTTLEILQLRLSHPTLFVIPPDGKSLQVYSLLTGKLENSYYFRSKTIKYKKVTCLDTRPILVNSVKSTLPPDISEDAFLFSYPPLRLTSRIQVQKGAVKNMHATNLEFQDEYLVLTSSTHVTVCDFQKLMARSKVESLDLDLSPSHIITEFTDVLLYVKSFNTYFAFDPAGSTHYLRKKSKEEYELVGLTKSGPVIVDTADLLHFPGSSTTDDGGQVNFLRNFGPRILVKDRGIIKIWSIMNESDSSSPAFKLTLLFQQNYNHAPIANGHQEERKRGLRQISRVTYVDDDVTLDFSECDEVKQLAVVKFTNGSVECLVYDSFLYQLLYRLTPNVFNLKKDEMFDNIMVSFVPNMIVAHKITAKDQKMFVFNLIRGLY